MSQTCAQVINRALIKLGVIDAGRAPTSTEALQGLTALQGFYSMFVTAGALGRAKDVFIEADYTAEEYDRVFANTSENITVTIPGTITECGVERPPRDCAFITVADGSDTITYLYDAYDGRWTAIEHLELGDDAPFSGRDREGLACALALELADDYAPVQAGPLTVRRGQNFKSQLTHRLGSPARTVEHVYF